MRINDWVSIIVFVLALVYFLRHGGFRAERETSPYYAKRNEPEPGTSSEQEDEDEPVATPDG